VFRFANEDHMMSYEIWHGRILDAARDIASREFQEEAWFPGGRVRSSPDEVYQVLMEDCTADLFFQIYGGRLTEAQLHSWYKLRSDLQAYYIQEPPYPDPDEVLKDPAWYLVRQSATSFIRAFSSSE
jgi:hypothetical protein